MSFVETLTEKLKTQTEYEYELTEDHMGLLVRLGNQTAMIHWRMLMVVDRPYKIVKHTEECVRKQSVACPICGELTKVEIHEVPYESTYYDAHCKKGHWWSDDDSKPIDDWLEENDYYYSCDCPLVEMLPSGASDARSIFKLLYWKNKESKFRVVPKG